MKRDHRDSSSSSSSSSSKMARGKEKIIEAEAGEDELLAVLGYKVRTSDMADVAQKLEQLEMIMYNEQEDGISHLSSDTVHYNPSDISTWLESMLSEFNIPAESSQQHQFPQFCDSDCSDLCAIPGDIVFGKVEEREKKRMKPAVESGRPVVLVDSQEMGIRLVHTLIACAKAIHCNNLDSADALVQQIGVLAASQAGAMGKVATYFAEALARRIYKIRPSGEGLNSFSDILELYFYESCPYLKFAHFTANQAILEAFDGKSRVHVIDFSMKQGMQWPALIQALAVRPGGPPTFRLTGIGPPQRDNTDTLKQVGSKLGQLADTINVEFSYQGIVANSLADIEAAMLDVHFEDCEAVAVNSVFELHRLLALPGAIDKVLTTIKALQPKIVTIVEQEADHNVPDFLDRFNEALHYYSTMFDSLEGCGMSLPDGQDQVMSEVYLGTQICNVVACEGVERVERHEKLVRWQARMRAAGFSPVHLGSNAFKQASMLLGLFGSGDGYRVEENDGCLMLGWHTRPLIATSAWHIVEQESGTNSSRYQAGLS